MGLEDELSELAVIRPIRTAVSSEGGVKSTRPGGEDAADTGCVTPTAAVSTMPQQQSDVDVDAGCVTPTTAVSSMPLQSDAVEDSNTVCVTQTETSPTSPRRGRLLVAVLDDAVFTTPTSAASALRPSMECPPAPRKPARSPVAAKRKRCGAGPTPQRCFFPVPRDLTKVFVARGPPDSSPPQAAKKVRVHPVG
jgi:hypothetical protein